MAGWGGRGGCGGERDRAFRLSPCAYNRRKVWPVSRYSCLMQRDLSGGTVHTFFW